LVGGFYGQILYFIFGTKFDKNLEENGKHHEEQIQVVLCKKSKFIGLFKVNYQTPL